MALILPNTVLSSNNNNFTLCQYKMYCIIFVDFEYRLFVSIKHSGAQNAPPFLPKQYGGNYSSYLQNAGRFSKTFMTEILIQTPKYCVPQIKYLLIHVFFINFRQRNVKLVLLKEFKPIIPDFASENQLFCECRKFIANV